MRRLVFAFGLIVGCEDEAPPPPPPQVVVEVADTGDADVEVEEATPDKPKRNAAETAHDLLLAGAYDKAVSAAGGLADADLGSRLIAAAVLAGAKAPKGTDALLIAEAKLAGGDAAGALVDALKVLGDGTSDAAVLLARCVVAGAALPEDIELPESASALVSWVTAKSPAHARRFATKAAGVKGWRAERLRASTAETWGDRRAASAAVEALASSADPRAKLLGLLAKIDAAHADKRAQVSAESLAEWSRTAHVIALAEGSLNQIHKATYGAVTALKKANNFPGAYAVADASRVLAIAAGVNGDVARLATADAALLMGDPVTAIRLTDEVAESNTDVASGAHQRAAWIGGVAAWQLGRLNALQSAAGAARGPNKDALKAMVALMQGDLETARLQFPTKGLDPQAAAMVYGLAARADVAQALKWHDRAIKGADESGISALGLSTRLAKEQHLRSYNRAAASAVRRDISKRFNLSPVVGGELAVRAMLGGAPTAGAGAMGPSAGIWRALAQNKMPVKVEGKAWAGLLHWARGRAAAATGRLEGHDGQFPAALGKLPLHRVARLGLGTVVDGSQGVDLETDVDLLAKIGTEMATGLALSAHDIGHRMDKTRLDLSLGMRQLYGLNDVAREALLLAVAQARAGVSAWHAGRAEFPAKAFEAVGEAEAKAAEASLAFAALLPQKGSTSNGLLSDLRRGAVISYRAAHGRVQAVALSREGNAIRDLGPSKEIFALAAQYRRDMAKSAMDVMTKTDHSSGHFLRTKVIDPFVSDLIGVGRYVVVGPPELTAFSFTTLPEQAEGLRWLADIRQMAVAPTIATLHRSLREVTPDTYKLDFLAYGRAADTPSETEVTNFEAPNELTVCQRYFQSGFNDVRIGADATLASWKEKTASARYIHIAELSSAMGGGFKMGDGVLSLDEVRNTPLHAEMVVITARSTAAQQQHRARAFLDAGARWVLVSNWAMDDATRVQYLGNIYDSMNQERPPVRAMSEGRNRLFSDALRGIDRDDPALWGGLTLFGKP